MSDREIGTGASCFLVKDERIKGDWHNSIIYQFLEDEGFVCWGKAKSHTDIDWLYINIYSKVYAKGMYGVSLTKVVGDHAVTFDEFLIIYNIYKKYEYFAVLSMTEEEQDAFDKKFPLYRMEKIIGCDKLSQEILKNYLSVGWWQRKMLPWEHCGKAFQKVCFQMYRERLKTGIHLCIYQGKTYYFGLGLEEPEVTEDMLENAEWLVYTWSD